MPMSEVMFEWGVENSSFHKGSTKIYRQHTVQKGGVQVRRIVTLQGLLSWVF